MTIRNYTTQIPVDKTILEIESILIKFGAKGIYKEYTGAKISGLMFYLERDGQKIPFKIPSSVEKSRRVIMEAVEEKKLPRKYYDEPFRTEQGERVTWRIIKDWIDSQLSLLEINFADAIEIMLPYAYNPIENKTMYQKFMENKKEYLALEDKQDVEEK